MLELSELTAYAEKKYHIREQFKWKDFPGYSVLVDPYTEKWVALLMRQWDMESGTEIQRCDLKCGRQTLDEFNKPYLSHPLRMRGGKWLNVVFDERTEPEVIFRLFDRAMTSGEQRGFTFVLDNSAAPAQDIHRDTALPFSGTPNRVKKELVPARIRQMRKLFEYGSGSSAERAKNFYLQGLYMADYEDDVPWQGDFFKYFPTYHDLSTDQLRGYFTWRGRVRKGLFQPIPVSAAYIYLYELINNIGTAGPEDSLRHMAAFELGFLDSGYGDARMRKNLRRWMLEFSLIQDLHPETCLDPKYVSRNHALAVLRDPAGRTDGEVFDALCFFGGNKISRSPVLTKFPEKGRYLFSQAWRAALSGTAPGEEDLFSRCFGKKHVREFQPFANAVYCRHKHADCVCNPDECTVYRCTGNVWQEESYEKVYFDPGLLRGFLHQTDLKLRQYLRTGRYLKPQPENSWADPLIDRMIEADRQAAIEAARPKISIDLSGLEQIRRDALTTRDHLLTEEELAELKQVETPAPSIPEPDVPAGSPLDPLQLQVIRSLLRGEDVRSLLKTSRVMPSLIADTVNEAMYDEIGDTVLSCEDDELSIIEDYREDIARIIGEGSE